MVHMLASHLRSEFLAVPELIRLDMAHGQNGPEPTLLIKSNSLSLKYLLRRRSLRFVLTQVGSNIAYAVEIPDDPDAPAMAWSLMALPNEALALKTLIEIPRCVVFLFNELAVSVAWTELDIRIHPRLANTIDAAEFHPTLQDNDPDRIGQRLDEIRTNLEIPGTQVLSFSDIKWHELHLKYVTNALGVSSLSLFNTDEGAQQEEIAVWLTDNLHPKGCVKSPRVQEKRSRELSDILISHEFGVVLIESKSLNILTRESLPDRAKLAADITKHIRKATKQLSGGIRNLRNNLAVTDLAGNLLNLPRLQPAHAIILVPDLSLLKDSTEFGFEFIYRFMNATRGFLHFLDPAELLRMVQAAEMISEDSENLTKMMAFDWYLMERAKVAIRHKTPSFGVLFRKGERTEGDH